MDDIDLLLQSGTGDEAARQWASRVRTQFVSRTLDAVLGSSKILPKGLVIDSGDADVVVGLYRDGLCWSDENWSRVHPEHDYMVNLDASEVAFFASAIESGAGGLLLHAGMPLAMLDRDLSTLVAAANEERAPEPVDPPSGSKIYAVVDPMDSQAVMDLIAVSPGPKIHRRHDGRWMDDPAWIHHLRGVKPPTVRDIDPAKIEMVVDQVDESTFKKPFKAVSTDQKPVTASVIRAGEVKLEWALLAARTSPPGGGMPPKLKKYWLFGKGAAKIRWGTPGAWTRCHRQLRKHMPSYIAKGACTNLAQNLGGHGVATHVGS